MYNICMIYRACKIIRLLPRSEIKIIAQNLLMFCTLMIRYILTIRKILTLDNRCIADGSLQYQFLGIDYSIIGFDNNFE